MDEFKDIVQQYFEQMAHCNAISCQKVIFEPETKREWFFEDDYWCFFEFYCDDKDYVLRKRDDKTFTADCEVKDMSYEIKMLLAYVRLRSVVTIEKSLFSAYVTKYEKAKELDSNLTVEKFNFDIREKEEEALIRSDKIANGIMGGCLVLVAAVVLLFALAIISYIKMRFFS